MFFIICIFQFFPNSRPENEQSVEHWLHTIEARVGADAPVILVGTHLDDAQLTATKVDALLDHLYDKYQSRFPNIAAYAPLCAATNGTTSPLLGVAELRQHIELIATKQRFVGRPLPPAVVALDAALTQLRRTLGKT